MCSGWQGRVIAAPRAGFPLQSYGRLIVRTALSSAVLFLASVPALASGGFNVPEPGAYGLMAAAALAAIVMRRRSK